MRINRTCTCGTVHEFLPGNVNPWPGTGLVLFSCHSCQSTISAPCPHPDINEDHNVCADCGENMLPDQIDALELMFEDR